MLLQLVFTFSSLEYFADSYLTVMCPDRKLEWFKKRGFTSAKINVLKKMVTSRWTDSYAPADPSEKNPPNKMKQTEVLFTYSVHNIPKH
jgi:uncharacterized protein (DUF3820 family)